MASAYYKGRDPRSRAAPRARARSGQAEPRPLTDRPAAAGDYPADGVLQAARDAFARGRPYHAHDATAAHRGWRSRKRTHALGRWAQRAGYLSEEPD